LKNLKSKQNLKSEIMIDYWKKAITTNYANFDGRARRSEYWYFTLMNIILIIALEVLMGVFIAMNIAIVSYLFIFLLIVASLGLIVPSIAVTVRRLHDIGKSGWFYCVSFIPLAGPIWLLVMLCTDSQAGSNEYGLNPKTGEEDLINTIK
jgi:uncharacterized membrane protein YhaH (DUF805 family)